jgi:YVTN family beta-propeller protein
MPSAYVANSNSNDVSVIDITGFTVTATIVVGNSPRGVCVTPDLSTVYVSNYTDGTVSIIDALTNTVSSTVTVGTGPGGIAVTPDGTKVLVTNFNSGNVSVISVSSGLVIGTITLSTHSATTTSPWAICISPDSTTAYVSTQLSHGSTQGYVEVLDIATLTDFTGIMTSNASGTTLQNIQGICISPNGDYVYVTGPLSGVNDVISTASNTIAGTMSDSTGEPHSICVLPNGTTGFWTNSVGNLNVFNPATFAVTTVVTLASGDALAGIAPTSDSAYVFVADDGSSASNSIVWKVNAATPTTHSSLNTLKNFANGVGIGLSTTASELIVMIV